MGAAGSDVGLHFADLLVAARGFLLEGFHHHGVDAGIDGDALGGRGEDALRALAGDEF